MNILFKYLCYGLCLLAPCLAAAQPEINVTGNGQTIADGANSPNTGDHTDFGAAVACPNNIVRTFTIENTGTSNLVIHLIDIPPAEYSFQVGGITLPATVLPGGSTTFTVTFNAGYTGTFDRNIYIYNNDSDETPYDFAIRTRSTSAFVATISTNNSPYCFGSADGSLTATGSGGSFPHSYAWSNGMTTSTITGLVAGTYVATVTGADGCGNMDTMVMTQPALPVTVTASVLSNYNGQQVTCYGSNDGAAQAIATGGSAAVTYQWSPSTGNQTTSTATGLAAGSHTVTVTDANFCSAVDTVTISEPQQIAVTISSLSYVSCFGGNDGSATASATGGTGAYSFLWTSNGQVTATATGLVAGSYTVAVTDVNGCSAVDTVTISEPQQIVPYGSNSSPACAANGTATAFFGGGTGAYSYVWPPTTGNQITATATGLVAGSYTVTVTDLNGCTASSSVTVNSSSAMSISPTISHIACNGAATGSISLNVTGGTPNYSFLWSNAAMSATVNGLAAGNYTVTVTDAVGCTAVGNYTINQPNALSVSINQSTPISCNNGTDGTLTATVTGGNPVYVYNWSNGMALAVVQNLSVGTYTLTVTDINGCTATASYNLGQPTPLSISISNVNDVTCFGGNDGSFTVAGTGGTSPYTYQINGQSPTANPNFLGLAAGVYQVFVVDANGCTASQNVTILQPTALSVSIQTSDVLCFGGNDGSATALVSGGTPVYTYLWMVAATTSSINGLQAGTYSVTVVDANGCAESASATINQPIAPSTAYAGADTTIAAGGTATLQGTAVGTAPVTFFWTPGAMTSHTETVSPTVTTNYVLLITDSNNCTDTDTVTVFVSSLPPSDTSTAALLANTDTLSNCFPLLLPPMATYTVSCAPQYGTFTIDPNLCYEYLPNGVAAEVTEEVCVTICEGTYCQTYTLMIPLASCVYPGDADTNRVVDNFDLLPIGLGMGETGNLRPNASLNYDCQPANDWATSTPSTFINYKHSDTDGDGIVTNDDTLAIVQNWGLVHLRNGGGSLSGDIPLYLDTVNCVCNLFPGETVAYPILLGDAANPVGDGYGFAFTLNYLQSQVADGSIRIDFGGNNWMGDKATGEVISIQKDFPQAGALKTAITRTDGMGIANGFGQIGTLYFTIKDDILRENAVELEMAFTDIRLITAQNVEMGTNPVPVVLSVRDTISTTLDIDLQNRVQIYPNPARSELHIASSLNLESVAVYNALGQRLYYLEPKALQTSLSVSDWMSGIYWLELTTSNGRVWQRVVKE